jgi:hypothetical protein
VIRWRVLRRRESFVERPQAQLKRVVRRRERRDRRDVMRGWNLISMNFYGGIEGGLGDLRLERRRGVCIHPHEDGR